MPDRDGSPARSREVFAYCDLTIGYRGGSKPPPYELDLPYELDPLYELGSPYGWALVHPHRHLCAQHER